MPPATSTDPAPPHEGDINELRRLQERLAQRAQTTVDLLSVARALAERSAATLEERLAERLRVLERREHEAQQALSAQRDREATQARAALAAAVSADISSQPVSMDAPQPSTRVPAGLLRVGAIVGAGDVPALLPGPGTGHVIVEAPADQRATAIGVVATVLLRALASAEPGAVRYRLYDPTGLGATLRAFNAFDREAVAHGTPMANRADLDAALTGLRSHATNISANYLRGDVTDLRAYLANDPQSDLGHELLVLLDQPRGLDDHGLEQLSLLAAQAASRGIMLIVHRGADGTSIDLGTSAVTLRIDRAGRTTIDGITGAEVRLDAAPTDGDVERVAARPVRKRAALEFDGLHDVPRLASTSEQTIATPIGRSGPHTVEMTFGDDPVNALVAGIAGSGKSMLLRTLVYGLARRFDATELQMYLLDFKEGVEFQEFAPTPTDSTFLPQAAVVSVNSSREFGVEVLRHLNAVARERYALFGRTGAAAKLEALRAKAPDLALPRILLVVDEFHRLFDSDDALAAQAAAELANLSKQGRAAGVHFVLATQSIGDVGIGTAVGARMDGIFKNATLRVGLRLSETESRQIFSSASNTAAAEIHEPGVAIVNASGGHDTFNVRTRVAYLDDSTAASERRQAVSQTRGPRIPPRTFDGARGASAEANRELRMARRGRRPETGWVTWPAQLLRIDQDDPRGVLAARCSFTQERRRNLAITGAGLRSALAITQWAALGLAATKPEARFILIDLLSRDDEAEHHVPAELAQATAAAIAACGARVEVTRERRATDLLARLDAALAAPEQPTAFVLLGYTDRLTGLDAPVDPEGFERASELLAPRLAEAPNHHVHTIASFASRDDLEQLDPRGATFGYRAYLELPEVELRQLTSSDVVTPHAPLAIWHDASRASGVELLHVYEPFGADTSPSWWASA